MNWIRRLFESRFMALVMKEINQILRNKQLLFLLLFPPTVQILIYGFALNPDVHHLRLGVVDYANVSASRELIAQITNTDLFDLQQVLFDDYTLSQQVQQGKLTAGLVIPPDFGRDLARDQSAELQVFIDGVDANTAGIASGYISQMINQYSRQLQTQAATPMVQPAVSFLYNPGLTSSWFFVPGVMGVVLTLIGSLVSSVTVVREKDTGTLEQLLMTPAAAWEILMAKIVPLFVLLMGDVLLALSVGRLVFHVPFRGNFPLFMALSGLYVFVGIGLGIMLATISRSQQQVVLTSFFFNLPLIQLSGAIAPIESMPTFLQYLSLLDPLRHYVAIVRGIMLKGVGLEVLWSNVLALASFAVILMTISINRFRNQLS